jgi:uncharacterized membrane protein (UPF0127 family)
MRKGLTLLLVFAGAWGVLAEEKATSCPSVVFPDRSTVSVEVADTEAKWQRGLMFRTSLEPYQGMLFVYHTPASYPIWMRNCLFSMDIIWLDEEARVLSIAASVPPCRLDDCTPPCNSNVCPEYTHEGMAKYVVEVAAGFAETHGVKVGDQVVLRGITGQRPS